MAGREEQKRRAFAVEQAKRSTQIVGLSEMARIIRFGREGNISHLVAYANLLADKIEEAGHKDSAERIRKIARGEYGATIIPMASVDTKGD
jgi:hypothetical protein